MTSELAIISKNEFALMDPSIDVGALIDANLAGEEITLGLLDRVTVPSGGGTIWMIPDESVDGGVRPEQKIVGIILHTCMTRARWISENPSKGTPPDCRSKDAVFGEGNPGGACKDCPLAQFGTAKDGQGAGQACKKKRVLFILTKDGMLPMVINIPPKSLGNATKYLLDISTKARLPHYAVVTEMTLKKAVNATGQEYAQVFFRNIGKLDDVAPIKDYIAKIGSLLQKVAIEGLEEDDDHAVQGAQGGGEPTDRAAA